MKIQVLGIGCAKCKTLYANVERALSDLGLEGELEKVEDLGAIRRSGVMSTPALAVDGTVKLQGRVPSVEELKELLA